MTRVLVTGGTGYIGTALLRELIRSDVDASALLHDRARQFLLPRDVEFHTVDELEDDGTAFDVVVHLGYGTALGRKETLSRNKDFADRVLQVVTRSGAKLIYASTTAVGGYGVNPRMDYLGRLSRYNGDDVYTFVKGRLEDYMFDACAKRNAPLTVVRIGRVMGPSSLWARIILGHLTKQVPFLVEGAPSNTTSIFNLVELLRHEIESPEGSGITLSTEMSQITWPQWAQSLVPEHLQGMLDVERLRFSETPRRDAPLLPRLATGLYGTVMSNARLKSLVARAPKRVLAMTEPWVKVPSVQANKAMAKPPLSGTERLKFSGNNAVPAGGVTEFSFAYTAKRIMEWAVWANYFVEHEARQ